jgi:dTDP-4-dehydrorhamnose 3,5-epimerase
VKFQETDLAGAFIIDVERIVDDRGSFARSFCRREFEDRGLNPVIVQCGVAFTARKGTIRGLHYQRPPYWEVKLVRCTAGAIYDVIVDLRPTSATFLRHYAVELTSDNGRMLYVPVGFAHGMQTLTDDASVAYQMSEFHTPEAATGVRWNDPAFEICWPLDVAVMSDRDNNFPDFLGPTDPRIQPLSPELT